MGDIGGIKTGRSSWFAIPGENFRPPGAAFAVLVRYVACAGLLCRLSGLLCRLSGLPFRLSWSAISP